eukprot:463804-Pelagomonas_calceolata.AAC.1
MYGETLQDENGASTGSKQPVRFVDPQVEGLCRYPPDLPEYSTEMLEREAIAANCMQAAKCTKQPRPCCASWIRMQKLPLLTAPALPLISQPDDHPYLGWSFGLNSGRCSNIRSVNMMR